MAATGVAGRVAEAVGESRLADGIARAQRAAYGPIVDAAARSPLHSAVLGHSLHPPLTDVTTGCWLATSLLDALGGVESRRAATLLAVAGTVAAVPTAVAGAADWSELAGAESSIGAVHALGTDVATFLFIGSVVARGRGRHRQGARLALAANVVMVGAGLLGGHLALSRGTAARS